MWRVGVIGAGYWSEKHIRSWEYIDEVELVGLCDLNMDHLVSKAEQFNLAKEVCFNTAEKMLRHIDVDIVDIITPPDTHLELVKLAAEAGKHIMCQKPFAQSVEEAEEMLEVTERNGVRLMVTENWRWMEPFQIVKDLLLNNAVGNLQVIRYIHTDFYSPRFSPEKTLPQPFFRDMPRLLFYEMGAHWFDTWRYLFGEPKRLYAETKRISKYTSGEDSGIVMLGYDDYFGTMDMSWATRRELNAPLDDLVLPNHKEALVIEGDKATVKLYINGRIGLVDNSGVERTIAESTELNYQESHKLLHFHFINCLNSGEEFQNSVRDNLKTLQLVFSTYKSAETHEVIHF